MALLALSGCTTLDADPTPSGTPTATVVPTQAPTDRPVVLLPGGTAEENLPLFTQIINEVWESEQAGVSAAYAQALVDAGFSAENVQRNADTTTVGVAADTFSIAVAWPDGNCLIGQVGQSTGDPIAAVTPQLGSGGCLIGAAITGP